MVPLPNRASWTLGSIVVLALIGAVVGLARNPQVDWSVFGQYLFNRRVLAGLLATIELSALALVLGIAAGMLMAGIKLSPNRVLSSVADLYIWLFRGVPAIVQLLIWGNIGLFMAEFRLQERVNDFPNPYCPSPPARRMSGSLRRSNAAWQSSMPTGPINASSTSAVRERPRRWRTKFASILAIRGVHLITVACDSRAKARGLKWLPKLQRTL